MLRYIQRRTAPALLAVVALGLIFSAGGSRAAEYDVFSTTAHTWQFASPAGNLSDEPSGIAASRRTAGYVLWENEAPRGGMGMVDAVNSGGLRKTMKFAPTGGMLDFEDIAIGPCQGAGSASCRWVGDIGKRSADFPASQKTTFWLYRMAEPDVANVANGSTLPITGRFGFTVPAGIAAEGKRYGGSVTTYDFETLMVHPRTGDIYLVTKGQNTAGRIRILQLPQPLVNGAVQQLQVVTTFQMPHGPGWNPATLAGEGYHLVTGGDIHPDGRRFVLRTYGYLWEFRGSDFAAALASTSPVRLPKAGGTLDQQGEAFGYAPDGARYFTIGEKSPTITRSVVSFDRK